jgi:hypothetical protein
VLPVTLPRRHNQKLHRVHKREKPAVEMEVNHCEFQQQHD